LNAACNLVDLFDKHTFRGRVTLLWTLWSNVVPLLSYGQHSRLNEYVSIVTELYSYTHSVGLLLYE